MICRPGRSLAAALAFAAVQAPLATRADEEGAAGILSAIGALEGVSDPKCHATASRLEDFIYGTPLSHEARLLKNELLKQFARAVWTSAASAGGEGVSRTEIDSALGAILSTEKGVGDRLGLSFSAGLKCELSARDLQHYGSVAYSLRAILAVGQEELLAAEPLPRLEPAAISRLKEATDLTALALLKTADSSARTGAAAKVSTAHLTEAWKKILQAPAKQPPRPAAVARPGGQPLLRGIIAQKRKSYAAYNQISNQLFVRNLQVYFARLSWPKDPGDAKAFRRAYTETVIAFAADLYRAAAALREGGKGPVGEAEVAAAAQRFLPHRVNEYEDVVFFPKLAAGDRITIEAYDFDAFRDSGIHWAYLGEALDDLGDEALPDADPFAAELLAEQVAQFGVLALRTAGEAGAARDLERISIELLGEGMARIQGLLVAHGKAPEPDPGAPDIDSAPAAATGGAPPFEEVTRSSGVRFMHRSSDWLNRLLRGYLKQGEGVGTITIPPAFGGSGAAAEDVDGDGHIDLLLLGGLGNRLYLGRGDGSFTDITARSGIAHRREADRAPGEPRQPLIADFDNDGHPDILITYVDDAHRLYRGRGDGTFIDVTPGAGLGGEGLVGGPATTFDFDGDGLLDIYIGYFGDYPRGVLPTLKRVNDNGLPNRLFRNEGAMVFKDVTATAGVGDTGWGQAASHTDLDADGLQDLISGNDFGTNRYYRNRGDGSFEEIAAKLGTDKPSYTMSISVADLNADLRPDIYISNIVTMNKDEKYVLPGAETRMKFDLHKLANLRVVEANDLFLSSDGATPYLLSGAVGSGYSSTGWSWDADFFDADLDGDDDLYVTNGMNDFNIYSSRDPYFMNPEKLKDGEIFVPVAAREKNVFFENNAGKLRAPERPSGLEFEGNSRSAVYLDWDRDGDLDVCVNGLHERARLFRNNSDRSGRNWMVIELVGSPEDGVNRDAIGASIVFRLAGGRTVWREVHGGTGYLSDHPKEIHAGLGDAESAEAEIVWPNGRKQRAGRLAANKRHRIGYDPAAAKARP